VPSKRINIPVVDGDKQCNKCKQIKSVQHFGPYPRSKDGRREVCADCRNAHARADRLKRPEHYRDADYRSIYGISLIEYEKLFEKQGRVCAICGKLPDNPAGAGKNERNKRLHVDHNHLTGAVRGLLCRNCNVGIGLLGEDVVVLEAAIQYIKGADVR
jgi:hypothetical protein